MWRKVCQTLGRKGIGGKGIIQCCTARGIAVLVIISLYGLVGCVLVLINPRRACAARVTVVGLSVHLSVCLSVYDYSRTTGYKAAYERYQQLQCYKGMKNNVAILLKRLHSRDMANMHNQYWLTSTRFSPFSAPWTKGLCIQVQRCSKPTHDHAASL